MLPESLSQLASNKYLRIFTLYYAITAVCFGFLASITYPTRPNEILEIFWIYGLLWPYFLIILLNGADTITTLILSITPFFSIPILSLLLFIHKKYWRRRERKARAQGYLTHKQYKIQTSLQKVRDVLRDMEPNIQVQLTRIAVLSSIPKKQLKSILISLIEESDIGRYLPLEEVFIRSSPEDSLLEQAFEEWSRKESERIGKMK